MKLFFQFFDFSYVFIVRMCCPAPSIEKILDKNIIFD